MIKRLWRRLQGIFAKKHKRPVEYEKQVQIDGIVGTVDKMTPEGPVEIKTLPFTESEGPWEERRFPKKPRLSRAEIQRRARQKPGSSIREIGGHMKGSKHQLPGYRKSCKEKVSVEEDKENN